MGRVYKTEKDTAENRNSWRCHTREWWTDVANCHRG